jgi:hypothetical protein
MSIFVDASKRFELRLKCNIIKDANNEVICYRISPEGLATISCDVKARSFSEMSHIIEEATIINSVTGNPLLRTSVLCKLILSTFFSSIRITELVEIEDEMKEQTEVFYPDINNVNHIRYELVKALSKKWLELTGGK